MSNQSKNFKLGPWKIWNGGENPFLDGRVAIQLRDRNRMQADDHYSYFLNYYYFPAANSLLWDHVGGFSDIIAYREVELIEPKVVRNTFTNIYPQHAEGFHPNIRAAKSWAARRETEHLGIAHIKIYNNGDVETNFIPKEDLDD